MTLKRKVNRLLQELDKFFPWPALYSFIMTEKEKELFGNRVKQSKSYLEFGMGGSTFHALQNSEAAVYSVDSSKDWISLMRQYMLIRYWEHKRLSLFYINIGPTAPDCGYPDGNDSKALFPSYSASIFSLIEKTAIDTVLIDGRFRVACGLKTIIECGANDNLQILIHDFWNREEYHVLLKYLEEIDRADTLGVFKIKDKVDLVAVEEDYEIFKYNAF